MLIFKLIAESLKFAWGSLKTNLLRTILSLFVITIGIFNIIGVLTLVDSLEKNMKDSFSFLGAGIIYIEKWPFIGSKDFPWWKYYKRPEASYSDFKFLEKNLKNHEGMAIFAVRGNSIIKSGASSMSEVSLLGGTYGYRDLFDLEYEKGRYFTAQETEVGKNVAIIGSEVAKTLFPLSDAIGKYISVKGHRFVVIGTLKKEGDNIIGLPSNDNTCIIPYHAFRKIITTGRGRRGIASRIGVKGTTGDIGLQALENEIAGLMRRKRGLKPKEEDNFALNRPEAIASAISSVFDVLSIAGWVIGGFAILVGGFGIANMMFVSVKERTYIIGIQKSVGAKNYFILLQFLFEAIFLSMIGGIAAILIVFLLSVVINLFPLGGFELIFSIKNTFVGLTISALIGVLSGLVPAAVAAQLHPVVAIRSK